MVVVGEAPVWWRKNSLAEAGKLMLATSFAHLQTQQDKCTQAWGLGQCRRWDADFEQGTIRFENADDWIITAPAQAVGSYRKTDSSWEWAWSNSSIEPRLAEHSRLTRDYAAEFKLKHFSSPIVKCTEADAWQFAAVACVVGNADGVYRAPSGGLLIFLTFGPVDIRKP
jgi:hypothetical protein